MVVSISASTSSSSGRPLGTASALGRFLRTLRPGLSSVELWPELEACSCVREGGREMGRGGRWGWREEGGRE